MRLCLLALVIAWCHCIGQLDVISQNNLFDAPFDFPSLNLAKGLFKANVWRIPSHNPNVRALTTARSPFVLTNHSSRLWKATEWNLQAMHQAGQWSSLFGVVSLQSAEHVECGTQNDGPTSLQKDPSIFVSAEESGEGSSIRHSPVGSTASPFQIINQMTMLEFLRNSSQDDSTDASVGTRGTTSASNNRRLLYSTEFDSLEEELQVPELSAHSIFL